MAKDSFYDSCLSVSRLSQENIFGRLNLNVYTCPGITEQGVSSEQKTPTRVVWGVDSKGEGMCLLSGEEKQVTKCPVDLLVIFRIWPNTPPPQTTKSFKIQR